MLMGAESSGWGELDAADKARLADLLSRVEKKGADMLGYPCNQLFDYSELLPFLAYHMNNLGDPFAETNFGSNTHDFEREVISEYARLTHAPVDNMWGYVTNGGSEGNLYGLYLARELYPQGIVYYSEDTHYSVAKSLRLLGARSIMIRCQDNGEIDYADLFETLRIHRDTPPILFANIGTTMKGATDNVGRLRQILSELRLPGSYIHVDAALSGMILPFVDDPVPWDFAAGADSISTSGHKMIGSPLPCGIVIAKRNHVERIARSVEYVGVLDTTITGSRNAFCPLLLWYAMKRLGFEAMQKVIARCLKYADYAISEFERRGIPAWRNKNSITVVFPRPTDALIAKWQIAPYGDIGHLITMPHVTRTMIDRFVKDYVCHPPTGLVRCPVGGPGARAKTTSSELSLENEK